MEKINFDYRGKKIIDKKANMKYNKTTQSRNDN